MEYEITNIEVDEPVINEDKTEREYDAFVTVHSNLKVFIGINIESLILFSNDILIYCSCDYRLKVMLPGK